jgi:hypothetical protein
LGGVRGGQVREEKEEEKGGWGEEEEMIELSIK